MGWMLCYTFWYVFYQGKKSYNAGIITALTNRLGDVGILITIGLLVWAGD